MRQFKKFLCVLALLFVAQAQAQVAARIGYTVTSLGGSSWRYDYTVHNIGTSPFDELTIYFDSSAFTSLVLASSPAGWDTLVVQPDSSIPAAGYLDALANASFASGSTVTGLSVAVNFIGTGTPPNQPFDIVDPSTFTVLSSAFTSPIPEPSQGLLLVIGLLVFPTLRRRIP
jgi:hypothetical protein